MNNIIKTDWTKCSCCGEEYYLEELCLVDCELICVECVENDELEHTNDSRLTLIERNA
jgi:formylmethanofuran dehydrogenase subunit E